MTLNDRDALFFGTHCVHCVPKNSDSRNLEYIVQL